MASNHERVETTIVWTDGPADSVAIRGTFSDSSTQCRLLDVSGGKISGYVAESQLQPDARPRRDEEAGNALQPSFQLRKFLIWAMVVLLFVLLGIASALMDSV
ncbi:hypothetical protein LPJ78_003278 [Coemansia sp. RSA 989]|nr:hypothetical protein LPJ79_000958 [Coemansia sp. RSA 1821]KAJ1864542.1 hypothetical protein LPJ78_003278 [Coemansia sp. RSA 989]KAJ1875235.1 hypothetical protein LPJ55_000907 [Coemansia sp. RSA 990]KAJ2650630.1 hypothetical protein IWW40_002367 [Coemansia sp. RSA 1250]KAJ2671911.1 hypothetical protein IWW42_003173 [Coemansia sp. RSA 1085]